MSARTRRPAGKWWPIDAGPAQPRLAVEPLVSRRAATPQEEPAPPLALRAATWLLAALLILLGATASIVHVDIIVQGAGKLALDAPPIVLQPMERAILRSLAVRPGDTVSKGQVLATLDPTFVQADRVSVLAQQATLSAQLERIEAERSGLPYDTAEGAHPTRVLQAAIHRQRMKEYRSRLDAFDEEIKRAAANIQTVESDRALLAEQLGVARDLEMMRAMLFTQQSASKLQLLDARSLRIRAERDHQGASDRLSELHHQLQVRRAERQAFVDEWGRRLLEELERLRSEAARIAGSVSKLELLADLVTVTAPEDGVVLEIAKRSEGSVLREAEPLVTLAPVRAPIIAETMVGSADVGYPKPGDAVVVKVDAFPYQIHGLLKGRLLSISEESYASGEGMPAPRVGGGAVHRARIALDGLKLSQMPTGARLIPGMTVSAEIKVGTRSVMSYLLLPLLRGLGESFRES